MFDLIIGSIALATLALGLFVGIEIGRFIAPIDRAGGIEW